MPKEPYSYVLRNRRRWALTQREMAFLLGLSSRTAVSRIERAKRTPSAPTLIACCIVFGLSVPELFPLLHEEIEEAVFAAAKELYEGLDGKTDKESERKGKLLGDILARIVNRRGQKKV